MVKNQLNPDIATVKGMLATIKEFLKSPIPPVAIAQSVAPLLNQVNHWSTQVEQVIKQSAADVVFDYRNVLLKGWADTLSVGLSNTSLPAPFADFKQLVKAVMDAQAPAKSKTQVCLATLLHSLFGKINSSFRSWNALVVFTSLELLWTMMPKSQSSFPPLLASLPCPVKIVLWKIL